MLGMLKDIDPYLETQQITMTVQHIIISLCVNVWTSISPDSEMAKEQLFHGRREANTRPPWIFISVVI